MREARPQIFGDAEALRARIRQYDYEYYALGAPTVTDVEYDALMRQLDTMEKSVPAILVPNSPTQRVGGEPITGFVTLAHPVPMLSIDNCFDLVAMVDFHQSCVDALGVPPEYALEYKIDGLALSLIYENGELVRAVTRGDGQCGDDVTHNVRTMASVPQTLRRCVEDPVMPEVLEVRGEVYMTNADFARFREVEIAAGNEAPSTPRNSATGALRKLDPKQCAQRPIRFVAHGIGICTPETFADATHFALMSHLQRLGLPVIPARVDSIRFDNFELEVEDLIEKITELGIPIDGIVVKVNDRALQQRLGVGSKYPRWCRAYKWERFEATTTVTGITVQVGKTGVLTPVVDFVPVEIDGTSVTRASLFNKDEIDRLDIGVGDVIVVEKAGKIIPHVVRVEHEQRPPWVERFVFPEVCPTCGSPALQDTGGVYIRCIASATCPDQLKAALVTFGDRAHMYIDGLGPDLVEKLVDNKIVENLVQLYDILHKWQQFEQLPGVGKKKFERLVAGLEASKAQPLERWLSGLNIRHIGKSTAAQLVRRFGTIWEIVGATDEELRAVPGFGAASLQALKQFLDSPASCRIIAGLLDHGLTVGEAVPADRPVGALDGLSVVVTGELVNYTREQAQKAVRDAGGNPSSGVSAKTAFLVVGSAAGRVKLDKARTLGIEQIDEAEFTRRLQGATYG